MGRRVHLPWADRQGREQCSLTCHFFSSFAKPVSQYSWEDEHQRKKLERLSHCILTEGKLQMRSSEIRRAPPSLPKCLKYGMFYVLSPSDHSEVWWTDQKPPGGCSPNNVLCQSFSCPLKTNLQRHSKPRIWAHHIHSRQVRLWIHKSQMLSSFEQDWKLDESWLKPFISCQVLPWLWSPWYFLPFALKSWNEI